ncbi:fimbrial protein [Parabacteroides sp. PFB2-10]|uniref:fimbrial protein n=1 Tax=Parabacteroides sp. PFB2-10 TaxID=1742405 RepID=UPI002474E79D|nr:fimbrial protein [Parabacteroides sp. PFB2-10]
MKLKNILLLASAVGLFFSCTSESLIEAPVPSPHGEELQVSLTLSSEDILVSKANLYPNIEEDRYYYEAEREEKQINSCLVVVFDGSTDDSKVYWSKDDYTFTEHPDNFIYTLEGVKAKLGAARFLVVANPTKEFTYAAVGSTYAQFMTEYEENMLDYTEAMTDEATGNSYYADFTATKLVKVGEKVYTADKPLTPAEAKEIMIPLTQLAARVDISFTFEPEGIDMAKPELVVSMETVNDIYQRVNIGKGPSNGYRDITLVDATGKDIIVNVLYSNKPELSLEASEYYFYDNNGKRTDGKNKLANAHRIIMTSAYYWVVSQTIGWTVDVENIRIHNIEAKSKVLLDYPDRQNKIEKLIKNVPVRLVKKSVDGLTYSFSFYTYEREIVETNNLDEMLHITFDAIWENGDRKTKQLAQLPLKANEELSLVSLDNKGYPQSGASEEVVPIFKKGASEDVTDKDIEDMILIGEEEVLESKTTKYNTKYRIRINPVRDPASGVGNDANGDPKPRKFTDGVIHGNIYTLAGTITTLPNVSVDIDLEYAVNTWTILPPFDIPSFE